MTEIERLEKLRENILTELEALTVAESRLQGIVEELEAISEMRDRLQVELSNINLLLSRYKRRANGTDIRPSEPPQRPDRPQAPTRPTNPDRGDRNVYAGLYVGGKHHSITWRNDRVFDGIQIGQRIEGLAPILFKSNDCVIFGLMAAFADHGAQQYTGLEVNYYGAEDILPIEAREGIVEPGYGRFWIIDQGNRVDPGTAIDEGRQNAESHKFGYEHLDFRDGYWIYWGQDANGPGGKGIYQQSEWAAGCAEGVAASLLQAVGWANRNAVFRLEQDSWDKGALVPYIFDHPDRPGYKGNDQTKTFPPQGFEGPVTLDGGYRQLDNAHGMRWLNPAYLIGKYGYSFGTFCVAMMAFDVEATWVISNINDSKANPHWWSVDGIVSHTPAGIGSPYAGRQFNYAMQAIAAAWELEVPFELETAISKLFDLIEHIYDEVNHVIYRISFLDEFGRESNKWKHKVEQEGWDHTIPPRAKPDVYKGFEQQLVWLGLMRFSRVLDEAGFTDAHRYCERIIDDIRVQMQKQIRDLEVIGHPEWSSSRQAPFSEFILDTVSNSDLEFQKNSNQPWWSDHPLNSCTGDLR